MQSYKLTGGPPHAEEKEKEGRTERIDFYKEMFMSWARPLRGILKISYKASVVKLFLKWLIILVSQDILYNKKKNLLCIYGFLSQFLNTLKCIMSMYIHDYNQTYQLSSHLSFFITHFTHSFFIVLFEDTIALILLFSALTSPESLPVANRFSYWSLEVAQSRSKLGLNKHEFNEYSLQACARVSDLG